MFRHSSLVSLVALALLYAATAASAQVIFEEKSKDLGGAPRGGVINYQFKFTNGYSQELHVSGVRVSCGKCTSASVTKTNLQPGESAYLNVNVDTMQFLGTRSFTVYLTTDRPVFQETFVTVTAASREDIMLSPSTLSFGTVKLGAAPTAKARLEYRGGVANWTITGVENSNGFLQPTFREVSRQLGLVVYEVTVAVRGDCPAGSWHADVWLTTNDATTPKIRVPLTIEIQPALTAAPNRLDLGTLAKGSQLERSIVLRGAEPFSITKVEGLDSNIEIVGSNDEPKKVQILKLRVQAGADPGEFQKQLRVITSLERNNAVEITLRGSQR